MHQSAFSKSILFDSKSTNDIITIQQGSSSTSGVAGKTGGTTNANNAV
jgi:hypothetical protein